jgi:nucleoside-diphosphate-sugar epimerase
LHQQGVTTWSGDLTDPKFVASLPDAGTVFHMVGRKFGSQTSQAESWLTNVYLPAVAVNRFSQSRFVLLSSGNIYGLKEVGSAGSTESEALAPVGEYAQTCVGRERMTEAFATRFGTPATIIRLNYACELRYGVLVDIAGWVYAGQPVPLAMPQLNTLWQRDANELILRAAVAASAPPLVLNLTGPVLRVRDIALAFGRHFKREVSFIGEEGTHALLSDASELLRRFPIALVPAEQMIEGIATWMMSSRPLWNKPTKFEVVDGRF